MTADPQAVARDWITIWQSELTAAAADPEMIEGFTRMVDLWARAALAAAALLPDGADAASGRAGARPQTGAAAAAAAPDARDAAIERLAERVAELERIIAGGARDS